MRDAQVAQIRRFNRAVTQRVGALHDRYLARDLPLGAARLLWEIGPDGAEVRSLRTRLGLDAGYLSRLLRDLERRGFVRVEPSSGDARIRVARLTRAGRAERTVLDRRSDELAISLLAPLDDVRRERLVTAMGEVERLLRAALVTVERRDPAHPHVRTCFASYAAELDARFDAGFDAARSLPASDEELRPPAGVVLVATLDDVPLGCGALKFHAADPTEVKRMWVDPDARGLGIGRRLLTALEAEAVARGSSVLRLETNRALTEAVALYRSAGYREVAPFSDEAYADHWFEKRLPG